MESDAITPLIRVDRPEAAAEEVARLVSRCGARVIRVEGHSASGKSSLSKQLARILCGIHVDTDTYLYAGELLGQQLRDNVSRYLGSGLHVIVEGIRLEERLPAGQKPSFAVLVSSEFEDEEDRANAIELAQKLGTEAYFQRHHPDAKVNATVVVRVASERRELLAALNDLNGEPASN